MYDKLRENFPSQDELFQSDDWLHISGWNEFYANFRGFNYVKVYRDEFTCDEFISNQDNPEGLTFIGYRELEGTYDVLQNDLYEASSDKFVGINNGISVALAVALLIEELNAYAALLIGFISSIAQNASRVLFNSFEYTNSANPNRNKFWKLALATIYTVASIIGLTLLLASTQAIIEALPFIAFGISVARIFVNIGYAISNLALAITATNPSDRDRNLNQAYKRSIQALGALGLSVMTGLILFKNITATAISTPVKLTLTILSVSAMLYSTCREMPQIRTWQPLRVIFKDVNKRLDQLSNELNPTNISEKIEYYQLNIDNKTSPLNPESRAEKLFYHGGGMIEELNIIRDCDFYKQPRETTRNPEPSFDQKTAAQLFLKGILLAKIAENKQEEEILRNKKDFRFFRKTDSTNNTNKKYFFEFLLWYVGDKKDSLPVTNIFHEVNTPVELQNFLRGNDDVRLSIFSALNRKHSNAEALWRAIIKYEELFEAPQKKLICIKKGDKGLEQKQQCATLANNDGVTGTEINPNNTSSTDLSDSTTHRTAPPSTHAHVMKSVDNTVHSKPRPDSVDGSKKQLAQ